MTRSGRRLGTRPAVEEASGPAIEAALAQARAAGARPVEIYRLGLQGVMGLADASFGSVFLRDPAEPGLLRLACAVNWPQRWARFLDRLRIRVGRGPTGQAVAQGRPIAVDDVFGDDALRDWWEPARELGFASMITLPLRAGEESAGALSLYFTDSRQPDPQETERLLRVADRLARMADGGHREV